MLLVIVTAILSPMRAEGHLSIADKKTKSTTSPVTEGPSEVTETVGGFYLKVDPASHTVERMSNGKSGSASYSVKVTALSGFRDEVELSLKGLPETCSAFFNPEYATPKPVFTSILEVIVPPSVPNGVYALNITGASDKTIRYATATLIIEGEAAVSTVKTETTSATTSAALKVSVSTEQGSYKGGEDVAISGSVRLSRATSAANATVSLSVLDPSGEQIHAAALQTSEDGRFAVNFTLPSTVADGIYTVYATASMSGYKDAFASVSFTVGVSAVSVRIVETSITLPNGTLSSEFHPGETAVVWVAANSTGADLVAGNIWVEVLDPDNIPIALVAVVVTVHAGEQVAVGAHVILALDAKIGIYTVTVLVSDRSIVTGGKFLDSKDTAFIITSETPQTTTTEVTSRATTTSINASETTTKETTSQTSITATTGTMSQTTTTETMSETSTIISGTSEMKIISDLTIRR